MSLILECRDPRRAFGYFMGGFTFSGLGNYIANTVVADLFRTTRCNDVLRRVLTLNLLFPITQTLAFVSVAFWGNGNIRNIKNKDRKSTRLNSSHRSLSRMPSSA